jgi:hypothetical protein
MKRGGYIKRKTPMNRTGIKSKRWNGAIGEQPRRRLRAKSRTNSNRHVKASVNKAYRAANEDDEIINLFPRWCRWYSQIWHTETRYEVVPFPRDRDHVHHIAYGVARRWDIVTNLIALSQISHDWVHAHKIDGRILCLYAKQKKGELDWGEMSRIYGKDFRALIKSKEPQMEWVRKYWHALIGETE